MNKRDYPLSLAKDIQTLLKTYRKLELDNVSRFTRIENDYLIYFQDNEDPRFYFKIWAPNQSADLKSFFYVEFLPFDSRTFKKKTYNLELLGVQNCFTKWLGLINEYANLTFDEEEEFIKMSEAEFYADFEIIDEDAETTPFSNNQQILLYQYLEHICKELISKNIDSPELAEIISDTENLKNQLPLLTKKAAVNKIANIYARLKKYSFKLFLEIIDLGKKEIIKRILNGGLDDLGGMLDKFL